MTGFCAAFVFVSDLDFQYETEREQAPTDQASKLADIVSQAYERYRYPGTKPLRPDGVQFPTIIPVPGVGIPERA